MKINRIYIMPYLLFTLLLFFLCFSCSKEVDPYADLYGEYNGTCTGERYDAHHGQFTYDTMLSSSRIDSIRVYDNKNVTLYGGGPYYEYNCSKEEFEQETFIMEFYSASYRIFSEVTYFKLEKKMVVNNIWTEPFGAGYYKQVCTYNKE